MIHAPCPSEVGVGGPDGTGTGVHVRWGHREAKRDVCGGRVEFHSGSLV